MGNVRRKAYVGITKNGKRRIYEARECKKTKYHTTITVSIKGKACSIAILVANAFIDNTKNHKYVYHKNGDITDNRVENLCFSHESVIFDDDNLCEKDYLMKYYDVSRSGEIVRKIDGRKMAVTTGPKGYLQARLKAPKFSKNKDRRKQYKVHRLVAMFYLDDYSEDLQVNHKNGNKADNRVENLEMVTNQQNVLHAWRVLDSTKRRQLIAEANKRRDLSKMIEASAKKNRKKTAKLDDSGNVLAVYDSLLQAAESVNVVFSAIGNAIAHKTKSAGFYWKYL